MQINVFSQTSVSRVLVGVLYKENNEYVFQYDPDYARAKSAIPLGKEFPLYQITHRSKDFFDSLNERIPSKQNPEYKNYCSQWNISVAEKDPLILLSTIGNRGPSSFIFRMYEPFSFSGKDLAVFRNNLGLSVREFAKFLDVQYSTITKTEKGKRESMMLLKYVSILFNVPDALQRQLDLRGQFLHDTKIEGVKQYLEMQS